MAKKQKEKVRQLPALDGPEELTLGQALDKILCQPYRRVEIDFTDSQGKRHRVKIYRCFDTLVRADFISR